MTVSPTFRAFALDQLSRVAPEIRGKSMFGGVGIYSGDHFFALIDDDLLYLKVDDSNRSDFITRGLRPFRPSDDPSGIMQYYELPADMLEDVETLRPWVVKAIAAAAAKRMRKKGKR